MLTVEEPVVAAGPVHSDNNDSLETPTPDLLQDVTLSIISHPYLDELADKIRAETIPWEVHLSRVALRVPKRPFVCLCPNRPM